MQCDCGGLTTTRKVQEDYKIINEYEQCTACGRIYRNPVQQKEWDQYLIDRFNETEI